ncbi:MAG: dTDP-4-dehydrorhamnose 3,5-epimerase family protein [Deltaproteobacteria bacterium]|nr:dTDP-4-dehydrorhamnose 3,5-epimerase family protein [Deltaproteobacteria bacterium]
MKILEIIDLPLKGAKIIEFARFTDNRGYFSEVFQKEDFKGLASELGLEGLEFVQVNESRSRAKVIRGLHFQYEPPIGKMVRLLYGQAVDMALDVRSGSPTFGQMILVDMASGPSQSTGRWIWLPPGLAHGNFYLADSAIEYFCTALYNPKGEVGISPMDGEIDLSLCSESLKQTYLDFLKEPYIISERDKEGLTLAKWRLDDRASLV